MKKLLVIGFSLFLIAIVLLGCEEHSSKEIKPSNVVAKEHKELPKQKIVTEPNPPIRSDGKWVQLGARLHYIQGIVENIEKNSDGQNVIQLLVEKTFHSETDGVQSPYENGITYSFVLKNSPNIDLNHTRVIIYGGQVTSNDQDNFIGAVLSYYELNHQFVDRNGKEAILPPKEYPNQF